jgi:thioredoxin 1
MSDKNVVAREMEGIGAHAFGDLDIQFGRIEPEVRVTTSSLAKSTDDTTFEHEIEAASVPALVCFYADQGGMGDIMRRIAEGVARSRPSAIRVLTVDVDMAPKMTRKYIVLTTPTFVLFNKGKKLVTAVGYQRESDIQKLLARFLEKTEKHN